MGASLHKRALVCEDKSSYKGFVFTRNCLNGLHVKIGVVGRVFLFTKGPLAQNFSLVNKGQSPCEGCVFVVGASLHKRALVCEDKSSYKGFVFTLKCLKGLHVKKGVVGRVILFTKGPLAQNFSSQQ
eukprot:1402735-Amphidinium_carterae.1